MERPIKKVKLVRLARGTQPGREHIIYAEIRDMDGGILVSADIEYILDRMAERNWEFDFSTP